MYKMTEEQPLQNTVVLPQPLQTNQCFFCQEEMNATIPSLELLCHCKFHTACFLDRRFLYDDDHRNDTIEFIVRNQCPRCLANLLHVDEILGPTDEEVDIAIERIETRASKIRSTFLETYYQTKQAKKDLKNLKKTITVLRKSYVAYEKRQKGLAVEFKNEIETLVQLIKQIKNTYITRLDNVDEVTQWRSARSKFLYYQRKFIRDYKIEDFYTLCKIKELRLPSRWKLFRMISGARYYNRRRGRVFGCWI